MTATIEASVGTPPNYVHFRPEFAAQLTKDFGQENCREKIMADLDDWEAAPLPHQPGEFINYVRLNRPESDTEDLESSNHVLVIPGFMSGIQSLAPFAAAMAKRGYDVTLADENRADLVDDGSGEPLAARNQALNLAAIIKKEELQHVRLDVVAHSYGAPIFEQLLKIAHEPENNWTCFDHASVALIAPAEIHEQPQPDHPLLSKVSSKFRGLRRRLIPVGTFPDSYRAYHTDGTKAGNEFLQTNRERAKLEVHEVETRTINLEELSRGVGRLAIVPLAGDERFPDERYAEESSRDLFDTLSNVTVFTPISLQLLSKNRPSKGIRSGRGSDHCAILWYPETVAGPVDEFLQPEKYFMALRKQGAVALNGANVSQS